MSEMTGAEMIAAERERQIEKGFDAEHDRGHKHGELIEAAETYLHEPHARMPQVTWPFEAAAYDPSTDRQRELVIAGAFIAAEIDRLNRDVGAFPSFAAVEAAPAQQLLDWNRDLPAPENEVQQDILSRIVIRMNEERVK